MSTAVEKNLLKPYTVSENYNRPVAYEPDPDVIAFVATCREQRLAIMADKP